MYVRLNSFCSFLNIFQAYSNSDAGSHISEKFQAKLNVIHNQVNLLPLPISGRGLYKLNIDTLSRKSDENICLILVKN